MDEHCIDANGDHIDDLVLGLDEGTERAEGNLSAMAKSFVERWREYNGSMRSRTSIEE